MRDSSVETLLVGGNLDFADRRRRRRGESCCRTCRTATRSCFPGFGAHRRLLELPAGGGRPPGQHLPRQRPRRRRRATPRTGVDFDAHHADGDREDRPRRPRRLRRADRPVAARALACVSAAVADFGGEDRRRDPVARTRSCSASAAGSAACCSRSPRCRQWPLDSELLACVSIGGSGRARGVLRIATGPEPRTGLPRAIGFAAAVAALSSAPGSASTSSSGLFSGPHDRGDRRDRRLEPGPCSCIDIARHRQCRSGSRARRHPPSRLTDPRR